jgi:fatty acid synthase
MAFDVDQALRALIAIQLEEPLASADGAQSLDELLGGNSARRNAVLADLGKEFGVSAIDGAHELPLPGLVAAVKAATGGRYRHPGAYLKAAQEAGLKSIGMTRRAAESRLSDHFGLPAGRRAAVLTVLAADGGDLDGAVQRYGQRVGETFSPVAAQQTATAAVSGEAAAVAQARWKQLARAALAAGGLDPTLIDRPAATKVSEQPEPEAEGFNPNRLVSFTASTAWARADALRIFHGLERGENPDLSGLIRAASPALLTILDTLSQRGSAQTADRLRAAHSAAETALKTPLIWAQDVALITGAGPDSIAEAAAARLLSGGATVVVSTSRMTAERVARFKRLYRTHAARGAELHVVPLDQGDLAAVDTFVDWAFETLRPTLCLPFGAMPAEGDPTTYDAHTIRSLQVNLLGVERLVARLGQAAMAAHTRVHVVLPLSPNHGQMGRDGLYAEAKAGLEALLPRRRSEARWWGDGVTICGARIGWVRGTGLMAGLDRVYERVERELGIMTFSPAEMAERLLAECTQAAREQGGWIADMAGGMGPEADLRPIIEAALAQARSAQPQAESGLAPLPSMLFDFPTLPEPVAGPLPDLTQAVAIVGYGEVGPFGNARVRWSIERDGALDAAAALELAWLCGCVRFEKGRFVDAESGEPVDTSDLDARYGLRERVGIRGFEVMNPETEVLYDEVILEQDLRFSVPDAATAQAFCALDGEHTVAFEGTEGWQVVRKAGGRIRVPRALPIDRDIAGQLPTGWDAGRLGFDKNQIANMDPVALFNLLATAAAFRAAGLRPEELWTHVAPARIGCSVGSGMGGMRAIQRLYTESKLAERRQTDALQESLINVTAAYPAMTFYGGAGPMVHPVAACATAAVSVEVGVDLIRAGKAEVVVAGGADDICPEGARGFADMKATIDAETRAERGFEPSAASRPCDARRGGFVEAQGGGAMILCRADKAVEMGLPIYGFVAGAWSFGDGLARSVPAPGPGLAAVAEPLKAALNALHLTPDDVGAVSIHGTSTAANDTNETALHARIAQTMGRTLGNPLPVIAQKALTGHSKGGAAAWQINGVLQAMADGVVPGMPNLDEPDIELRDLTPLVYPDAPIEVGAGGLKAALVTSLGFGHVGACVCLVHPDVVLSKLPARTAAAYAQQRNARWRARLEAEHAVLLDQAPAITLRTPEGATC